MTHSDIRDIFVDKWHDHSPINHEIIELIHFREVAYDIFGLLNDDNDRILRKFTLKSNGEWDNDGELNQLYSFLSLDELYDGGLASR